MTPEQRDVMMQWRIQDVAKNIVETHAQATPRDWGAPDHALYKLIVRKLVVERDRLAALRAALGTCGTCARADAIEAPAGSVYCTLPGSWLNARRMPAEARCNDWTSKETR